MTNDDGFIKQINDFLYDNVDSQNLDVDFALGSGKSITFFGFEAISMMQTMTSRLILHRNGCWY